MQDIPWPFKTSHNLLLLDSNTRGVKSQGISNKNTNSIIRVKLKGVTTLRLLIFAWSPVGGALNTKLFAAPPLRQIGFGQTGRGGNALSSTIIMIII